MVVPDLLLDPRFADKIPEGNGAPLRFYAGAVIRSREGVALGTVCVFDHQPRQLDALQTRRLADPRPAGVLPARSAPSRPATPAGSPPPGERSMCI